MNDISPEESEQLVGWLFGFIGGGAADGDTTVPGLLPPDVEDADVEDDDEDDPDEGGVMLDLNALGPSIADEEGETGEEMEDAGADATASEWSDTTANRDERIAEYDGDASHTAVRDHLRSTGLMGDVREALKDLSTTERDLPAAEGHLLDMRNVTRRLAGDTTVEDIYRRRQRRPGNDVAVGVSVDMSGSMSSTELDAKAAVGAFLFAVQQAGNDVVANAWRTGTGRTPRIQQITGPNERFRWDHLDSVRPGGADPIARGMWECGMMLEARSAPTRLLIVITDGNPTVVSREDLDGYHSAVDEADDTVEELRARGLTVLGFGFGGVSEKKLERMFGADGYRHVDLDDLADALVDAFRDQHGQRVIA